MTQTEAAVQQDAEAASMEELEAAADIYDRLTEEAKTPPQTYERTWEWSGYSIREGRKGWIVDGWSRVQGLRTGWRYLVSYAVVPREIRLEEPINDHGLPKAELILYRARQCRDLGQVRVLRSGHIVA